MWLILMSEHIFEEYDHRSLWLGFALADQSSLVPKDDY